jgi:hypothetical protein
MNPTLFQVKKPEPLACLTVNGVVKFQGTWALAKTEKRKYMYGRVEVHSAKRAKGVCMCNKCGTSTDRPYTQSSEGVDYWNCDCGKLNWIRL